MLMVERAPELCIPYLPHEVTREDRPDGTILLRSAHALGEAAVNTGAWLHHWAAKAPDRVALAERAGGGWRTHFYAELLQMVRNVASALLARGLHGNTPIVILSGNSVDHQILSLAAQYVGVPVVPLAEQYALIPEAFGRLLYVVKKVRPSLAYVADASVFSAALALPELERVEVVASRIAGARRAVTPFAALLAGARGVDLAAAHAAVGPATLAKILFTSGSTADPKGVLTTHGMMCANQAQIAAVLPFLKTRPPRILDWLPWNHVFGGSHNVNMMLANGGSIFIDEGKPTKAGFAATLRNVLDHPGTISFNVPVGYAMLVEAMGKDRALRRAFFRELDLLFYSAASLPQELWERLERFALDERGALPLMVSSWGMTETAPAVIMVHEPIGRSGVIGVPLPGTTVKLLPDHAMRCQLRVKGPNVMQGYFEDAAKSQEAFDDEGFLMTGDAAKFADPDDASRGLVFDGRVAEDFKLSTGTWVRAGRLRLNALSAMAGLVQDVVVCGHDRDEIGLLIFPAPGHAHGSDTPMGAVIDPVLQAEIGTRLSGLAGAATGSAARITRGLIMVEPPSLKDQEITDKGSLNVRRILTRRADLLKRLYDDDDPALIRIAVTNDFL
jgi:feruloyl-CoA synthase